jgi:maltose/moltooligosaccharide transporter
MMIVVPMLIQTVSFGKIFKQLLGGNPQNAILFSGALLLVAALLTQRLRENRALRDSPSSDGVLDPVT